MKSSIILYGVKALMYVHSLWYILLDDTSRIPPSSTPRTNRGARARTHARTNTHNPLAVACCWHMGAELPYKRHCHGTCWKLLSDLMLTDTAVSWRNRRLLKAHVLYAVVNKSARTNVILSKQRDWNRQTCYSKDQKVAVWSLTLG
jgi:hypothetical protein